VRAGHGRLRRHPQDADPGRPRLRRPGHLLPRRGAPTWPRASTS
jgi:hypothetical protein